MRPPSRATAWPSTKRPRRPSSSQSLAPLRSWTDAVGGGGSRGMSTSGGRGGAGMAKCRSELGLPPAPGYLGRLGAPMYQPDFLAQVREQLQVQEDPAKLRQKAFETSSGIPLKNSY